jgi:CO/xanthine dehydrogenase FAD-binding subunit
MKPAAFDYIVPKSLDDAVTTLSRLIDSGVDVKCMAGGQSLMPLMNMRLATPAAILDLNNLADDLCYQRRDNDTVFIGSLTRHYQLEDSRLLARDCPVIPMAESMIGHPQIRSRGTVGGSLCHADPCAELPLIWTMLDGCMILRSQGGERRLQASEFFVSYLMTATEPREILTEVQIPVIPPRTGQAIEELSLRHGDFALAAVACQVSLDDQQRLVAARLAVGGAAPTPVDVSDVLDCHRSELVTDRLVDRVLEELPEHLDPIEDLHATAEYRLDLVHALAARAIWAAWARARA